MGIKQKDENSAGGLHNALAAGTTIKMRFGAVPQALRMSFTTARVR